VPNYKLNETNSTITDETFVIHGISYQYKFHGEMERQFQENCLALSLQPYNFFVLHAT